jgi:hypothetical protein
MMMLSCFGLSKSHPLTMSCSRTLKHQQKRQALALINNQQSQHPVRVAEAVAVVEAVAVQEAVAVAEE